MSRLDLKVLCLYNRFFKTTKTHTIALYFRFFLDVYYKLAYPLSMTMEDNLGPAAVDALYRGGHGLDSSGGGVARDSSAGRACRRRDRGGKDTS